MRTYVRTQIGDQVARVILDPGDSASSTWNFIISFTGPYCPEEMRFQIHGGIIGIHSVLESLRDALKDLG